MINYFKSKIFLTQFLSFFLLICTIFISITVVIVTITEISLKHHQLYLAESYRIEAAETMEGWIRGLADNIHSQTQYIETMGESRIRSEELHLLLKKQMDWNKSFMDIIVIDEKGNIINSKEGVQPNIDLSQRIYFKNSMQGKSYITGFYKGAKDSIPVMAISEPVFINGRPKYVVAGVITLERFKQATEDLRLGEWGHVYLINEDGMFITDSSFIKEFMKNEGIKNLDKYKLKTFAVSELLKHKSGTGTYMDFTEKRVFGSYTWVDICNVGLIVEFKESKVMKPMSDLRGIVGILALLVGIGGLIGAFLLSRRILRPINMLVAASQNIILQQYQTPINIKTDSELDILINTFNEMQTVIKERERELKIQTEEAQESSKLKGQFLANMSHELRTPLNSIIGFTTRVIKKSQDILPKNQLDSLIIVKAESRRLLELINDLLDYSKLEAGKMEVYQEDFDLLKIVNEVQTIVKVLMEGKDMEYVQECFEDESIPMCGDPVKLKQVLINLLSNAVKYSEKGTIKLIVSCEAACYRIAVQDQGIGIAPEDINSIFDEFRQLDGSYTRKAGGTGLGLSITKGLVELMGGSISVESTPGVGSCFTVMLPIYCKYKV